MVHDVQAAGQRAPAPLDEEASPCLAAGEDKSSLGGRPNPADGSSALPCMVMLPHRAVQGPVAPQLEHREPSNPEALLSFRAGEPPAQIPVPANDKPKLLLAPVKPVLRETRAVSEPTVPVLADTMGPEVNAQKRSEEHTSELQSRLHLVCRLLLEKKKHIPEHTHIGPDT